MKGDYPKDFLFRGWHPQCFCYTTSILLSGKEYRLLQATGKQPTRMVDDLPEQAQNYLKTYGEALKQLNSVPYFIRDNKGLLSRS